MADIVATAFGLKHPPFSRPLADGEVWLDDAANLAMERVVGAVSSKGHAMVKAEAGAGKTTLLRAMRAQLSVAHFRVSYIAMVTLGPRDFLRQLCLALGVESKATAAAAFTAIQAQICQMHSDHRVHPVIVIDEIHLMPTRTLQHLHILCNFDFDSRPLLSLVLVGLPEFHDRLRMSLHRSLLTRVSTVVELRPTEPDRTGAYVRYRLAQAGSNKAELFTPDALTVLHELSGGLLRSVDIIANGALTIAARQDKRLVDRHMITAAFRQTPLA